jgi:predicted transcriptional regulator
VIEEKEENFLENLFLREKPAKLLISIRTEKGAKYATQLSKEVDCTYSHTVKILEIFRKLGLVEFEKKGRVKRVKLTEMGWDLAHDMESIIRKFDRLKDIVKIEPKKKKQEE